MQLAVIQCRFQITEGSPVVDGLAICSNPDTPVTFIHTDGTPYTGKDIWTYNLLHYKPWALFN